MKPIYTSGHIKLYPDRLEFRKGLKKQVILINQITAVYSANFGAKLKIVTTGNKKFTIDMAFHSKSKLREAILEAVSNFNKTQNSAPQTTDADEIKKLSNLRDEGIITEEEFQAKKKQLLGL